MGWSKYVHGAFPPPCINHWESKKLPRLNDERGFSQKMVDNPLNVRVLLQSLDDQLGGETGKT